jgi:hypothetical protein
VVQRLDIQQKAVLKIFNHSKYFHYLNEKKALQKIKERDITHFGFPELYSFRECLGAQYEVLISCFGRNLKQAQRKQKNQMFSVQLVYHYIIELVKQLKLLH